MDNEEKIAYLERPRDCPPSDLCRCHLMWQDEETLLTGWANAIKILKVHTSQGGLTLNEMSIFDEEPKVKRTVEIVNIISTDFFISGISFWSETEIAVLAFVPPGQGHDVDQNGETTLDGEGCTELVPFPELHIIEKDTGKHSAADALPILGYVRFQNKFKIKVLLLCRFENLRASDYSLASTHEFLDLTGPPVLYIGTPKDVIIARTRDYDDRIFWAIENGNSEQAVALAKEGKNLLRRYDFNDVVHMHIKYLFASENYIDAASTLHEANIRSKSIWEHWVWAFAQQDQLSAIAELVPTSNPRLAHAQVYCFISLKWG